MIKVNIQKEALKKSQEQEQLLKQATQLLLEAGDKDREILQSAGLDHQLQEAETDRGKALKGKEMRMKYGHAILSESDVKELCIKYHLKCLPSKSYNGTVPPELGSVIARFIDKIKEPNPAHSAQCNLYIMAPKEMFALQSYKTEAPPKDPVLFYKFNTSEGPYYAIISKWGNDFTIFRALKGWLFANRERYSMLNGFAWFTVLSLIFSLFTDTMLGMILSLTAGIITTIVIRGIINSYWTENGIPRQNGREQLFSENGWDKETEHAHSKLFL